MVLGLYPVPLGTICTDCHKLLRLLFVLRLLNPKCIHAHRLRFNQMLILLNDPLIPYIENIGNGLLPWRGRRFHNLFRFLDLIE